MAIKDDEMNFVITNYGDKIQEYLGTKDIAATFYTDSEYIADEVIPLETGTLRYGDFDVSFYQDYSFDDKTLKDFNYCKVDGYKFLKIITPFTRKESYDFIVTKRDELQDVIKTLKKKELESREDDINFPIIGLDFTELRKNSIDFLLNEEFREYCRRKNIKLKRGIVLEGLPGTGKTLSIQWLKSEADRNGIKVTNFKNIDDFIKGESEFYGDHKNIFVFEDFDAALMDRKETGETPNQILAMILNTLDGIDKIEDVVTIFTTNKIDMFDDALLRPGRIDKVITYSLPTKDEMYNFFDAYIPEESQHFDNMVKLLNNIDGNVPYATLKGICDDINIWKFNETTIDYETIEKIVKDKIRRKNSPKEKDAYIL